MSKVSINLSDFIDDFISKNGNDKDKEMWEKKGKKWFIIFADSKILKKEEKSTPKKSTPKKSTPKRSMTPYNAYVKEQFHIVQEETPSMSPQNVMKEIAKRWNKSKQREDLVVIKSKTLDEPAEEVEDNSSPKNHTFFVFELFNVLFNVK